jgi:hypothetical protein
MKKSDSKGRIIEETETTWLGKVLMHHFYFYPSENKKVKKSISNPDDGNKGRNNENSPVRSISYESQMDINSGVRLDEWYRSSYLATLNFFSNGAVNISFTEIYPDNGITVTETYEFHKYYDGKANQFKHSRQGLVNSTFSWIPRDYFDISKEEFIKVFKRTFMFANFPMDEDFQRALAFLERV